MKPYRIKDEIIKNKNSLQQYYMYLMFDETNFGYIHPEALVFAMFEILPMTISELERLTTCLYQNKLIDQITYTKFKLYH